MASAASRVDWKAVWPIPTLIVSVGLLGAALAVGVMRIPKDDPAAPLVTARALVHDGSYTEAIDLLNKKLVPSVQQGLLSGEQKQEFYLLRARSLYGGQEKLGIDRPENHKAVLDDFKEAQRLGAHLEPDDIAHLAESNLALHKPEKAEELARSLPASNIGRRTELFRKIVRSNLGSKDVRYEQTLGLLNEMIEAPGLTPEDRAWAAARQTELRLASGFNDEAITKLLRLMPKLEQVAPAARGELFYLLGLAYYEAGQFGPAQRQLEIAERDLPAFDVLRADAAVLSAKILQSSNNLEEARDKFTQIHADFPQAHATLPALFGKAETASALGDDESGIEAFGKLIDAMHDQPPRRDLTLALIGQSAMDRQIDRFTKGDYPRALEYAKLAYDAFRSAKPGEPDAIPADVLLALGVSHRKLAQQIIEEARTTPEGTISIDKVDPVTASDAKRHFLDAGMFYREHARATVAADNAQYFDSLFASAECFDQAGDREATREAFQSYMDGAPDDDPRRPESKYRLAQNFQAERQLSAAADLFRELIAGKMRSQEAPKARPNFVGPPEPIAEPVADPSVTAGVWGDRARVPLAQCYLADETPENDAEAEQMLALILSGTTFGPDSVEYRDAITELAEHRYARGLLAGDDGAMKLLDEARQRYPDHPRRTALLFKLADSGRVLAVQIADELRKNQPATERQRLDQDRRRRLLESLELYRGVIETVNAKPARLTTELDRLYKRNATFYIADCSLELGDFAGAIKQYDAAAQAYSSEPASLVARVQIVRAYVLQNKWAEAMTANERAKRQLAQLPERAFEAPDLPMQRRHWEAWLEADALLQQRRQAAATPRGTQ